MNLLELKQKKYNFSWISDCRGALMGLAAIFVVLSHSFSLSFDFLHFRFLCIIFEFIKVHGNLGVNIFLMLSGLGLYYSLEKNSSVPEFYRRRFFRVFPSAFFVAILNYGFIEKSVSIKQFISEIFFLDFYFSGRKTFWYFSLIFLLYALYPLIHKFIKAKPTQRICILIIAVVILNIVVFVFFKDYFTKTETAFCRIPIFLVGVWLGYLSKNNKEIPLFRWMIVSVIMLISSFLISFHYESSFKARYEFSFTADILLCGILGSSIIMILSYLFHQFKIKVIRKILVVLGLYSMEIYLLYERIVLLLDGKIVFNRYNVCFYVVVFIITLFASVLMKNTVNSFLSACRLNEGKKH